MITISDFEYSIVSDRLYRKGELITGVSMTDGRKITRVDGKNVYVHRLIWRLVTGEWPPEEIDHENRINNDNRWLNLRLATHSQNGQNKLVRKDSKLGIKGVIRFQAGYRAELRIDGVYHNAYFNNLEDAVAWRKTMEQKFHPYAPKEN